MVNKLKPKSEFTKYIDFNYWNNYMIRYSFISHIIKFYNEKRS